MVDEVNARLGVVADIEDIQKTLSSLSGNEVAGDLRIAMSAFPLHLHWTKELPFTDPPPEIARLWVTLGDQAAIVGLEDRLESIVDRLTNPVVVGRVADILWWALPRGRRDYSRHARRGLEAHRIVEASTVDPSQRLLECWAGSQLAGSVGDFQTLDHFRHKALDAAFGLVLAPYSPELVGLRIDPGLGFLYGIVSEWKPLPVVREIIAVTEIAAKRLPTFPFEIIRPPAFDWICRLRFLAAGEDENEQVRVTKELCQQRRRGIVEWSRNMKGPGSQPLMELAELSRAIETAAAVAANLRGRRQREELDKLIRDMVVELQRLDWTPPTPKTALVNQQDLTKSGCARRALCLGCWAH